eukprot:5535596-Prymnesium_polylepis.1
MSAWARLSETIEAFSSSSGRSAATPFTVHVALCLAKPVPSKLAPILQTFCWKESFKKAAAASSSAQPFHVEATESARRRAVEQKRRAQQHAHEW